MWCTKHIAERNLCKGRPKDEIDMYEDAIRSLVKDNFLMVYKSQGRNDICIPKTNRKEAIEALKSHEDEYDFIRFLEFIK